MQTINHSFFTYIQRNQNVYLLNTEQLTNERYSKTLNEYPKELRMIDYMNSNLKYYDISYKKYILPYQINPNEIFNIGKVKDVCIIGTINNIPVKRQRAIDSLREKDIHVDIITGFGTNRDVILFKYKIIINIGYFDNYKIMETFRCDRCVYNKMIVVSDYKEDYNDYHLKDHVIFTEYDNIPDKVIDILQNYDKYYEKLFSNFDLNKINNTLANSSKELLEAIS